jgi:Flp pilus assembly protein TadG
MAGARRFVRRFMGAEGNVAIIFALSLFPMALMGLGAVDLHRQSQAKQYLQDALDAATLSAARSTATDPAEIQRVGQETLSANLAMFPELKGTKGTFTLAGDSVVSKATTTVKTTMLGTFSGDALPVTTDAVVKRGGQKLEVVLVLDNTGSMAQDGKLTALKTSATELVESLSAASAGSKDKVKIGLVPFSMTVRVGAEYENEAWIDKSAQVTGNDLINNHPSRAGLFNSLGESWAGCVESRPYPHDVRDTAPSNGDKTTLFPMYFAPDEPDIKDISAWSRWRVSNNYLDDGITSKADTYENWWARQKDHNKYSSRKSTYDRAAGGPNKGCEILPLIRLTTEHKDITDSIKKMVAAGNTNIPMGLAWGWHVLAPHAPFSDGVAYNTPGVTKIAILMTDGDNVNDSYNNPNRSTYSGVGYIWQKRLGLDENSSAGQRNKAMNDRLAELCANMKKKEKNISIFAIGVGVNSTTSALLSSCASPGQYKEAEDKTEMRAAFKDIAAQIQSLYISR